MLSNDGKYKLDDRESLIVGKNIKKDIKKIIVRGIVEEDIFNYLKNNMEIVEVYLSSNKYRKLMPDDLKIKYTINIKLDLKGSSDYLQSNK